MPEPLKLWKKIGIFVDVQNIYYTCRQAYQGNFDYNKFWAEVTRDREVVCAYAYATDRGDQKQAQFQNILRAIGFDVQLKAVLKRRDGTAKADWDVGIALDVFEQAQQVRHHRPRVRRRRLSASCSTESGSAFAPSPRSMAYARSPPIS